MSVDPLDRLTVMVPSSLVDDIKSLASTNERSISGEVRLALRAHLESARKEQAA